MGTPRELGPLYSVTPEPCDRSEPANWRRVGNFTKEQWKAGELLLLLDEIPCSMIRYRHTHTQTHTHTHTHGCSSWCSGVGTGPPPQAPTAALPGRPHLCQGAAHALLPSCAPARPGFLSPWHGETGPKFARELKDTHPPLPGKPVYERAWPPVFSCLPPCLSKPSPGSCHW